jgi:hypothetical protein
MTLTVLATLVVAAGAPVGSIIKPAGEFVFGVLGG